MSNLRGEYFENFKSECVSALAHDDNMGLSMSLIYDGDDKEMIESMRIARIESSEKLKLVKRASNFSAEELEEVVSVLRRMVLGQRAEALLEAGTKADAAEEQYDIAVLQWENNKNNKHKQTKNKKKQTWTKASREEKRLLRIHSCNNRFIDLLESKPSDSEGCQVM